MPTHHRVLLIIDAIINLILGGLLLFTPFGMATYLGVPEPGSYLYPCVLGGVLFGISLSLFLAAYEPHSKYGGLGIGGAIVINFCGAGALLVWLLLTTYQLPVRGLVLLWTIVIAVIVVGVAELSMLIKEP